MSYAPLYRPRRRRNWRPAAAVLVLAAGVLALAAVAMAPGRPKKPVPAPPAGVGDLIHAGEDSAVLQGVLALPGGDLLAAVRFVRGRHSGRAMFRVTGCPAGGELVDVSTGAARAWDRGCACIHSLIARAACGEPGAPSEES